MQIPHGDASPNGFNPFAQKTSHDLKLYEQGLLFDKSGKKMAPSATGYATQGGTHANSQ
jgi:hypothetical protein